MNLAERDLFELYRLVLTTICTVYAVVVMGRSLWGWVEYFAAPGKMTSVMRSYAVVALLQLRLRRFTWEFVQIGFWLAALAVLLDWHRALGLSK